MGRKRARRRVTENEGLSLRSCFSCTSILRNVFLLAVVAACLSHGQPAITLTAVAGGLDRPTDIQNAGDGSGRLFVVQQNGIIRIIKDAALRPDIFLDIRGRTVAGGERGLLGLAFPPGFPNKQYFYVNYTDTRGDTVIARYRVTANPDAADPASETVVLRIDQPFSNHNGGQLRFGPDGYLYVGTGDGGSARDPLNNGQSPSTLLGKMLRIDVESGLSPYRIPPDNPFAGNPAFRPEIWALGLRNPWRYSFDRATGDLWIADVGQNRAEEINFQPARSRGGENYGWRLMEGFQCLEPGCNPAGLTLPVHEYGRSDGCSVTGGHVYRGRRSPGLRGAYLYGDFCSGNIWAITPEAGRWVNRLLLASGRAISTFGEDEAGELFLADYGRGEILRIDGSPAPVFTARSVVNAASFAEGLVAGSAAVVFVAGVRDQEGVVQAAELPLPDSLGGVTVTVGGIRAPLFAVANVNGVEQVNFQVPFELHGLRSAPVVVTREGISSEPVEAPVLAEQPGVFTIDGRSALVVRYPAATLVSADNPLRRGEFAFFYATGLGPVSNNPGTGKPGPARPLAETLRRPEVTIGGVPCEVTFAGLAPGFAGVYQVNILVAENVPSGEPELVLIQNAAAGPPVAVQVE